MPRWKLIIEYDGTRYHGWQTQPKKRTVQGALEKALSQLCQQPVPTHVAGRTDKGVHALAQVAHADIPRELPPDRMRMAIQAHLTNEEIGILRAEQVPNDFHARFSAKKRHYTYRIMQGECPPVLFKHRFWWIPRSLDVLAMQQAANHLLGKHDFSSFRATGCQANSPIRSIDIAQIKPNTIWGHQTIEAYFVAPSFLYHQVRNMMGALAEVGLHRLEADNIPKLLAKADRTAAPNTAPACGLYFVNVDY